MEKLKFNPPEPHDPASQGTPKTEGFSHQLMGADYEIKLQREREARYEYDAWYMFQRSEVPSIHRKAVVKEPDWFVTLYEELWLKLESGSTVLVYGPRGTGKTQLTVELIRKACRNHLASRYSRLSEFYRALKDTFGGDGKTEDVVKRFRRPWLLVLDECHDTSGTDWAQMELNDLIDYRYGEGRPTILVSNLTVPEMGEVFGPSVISRTWEGGGAYEVNQKNWRKEGK